MIKKTWIYEWLKKKWIYDSIYFRWFGDGLQSLSQAYFTLYLPCGHTNLQGGKPGYIPSSSGLVNYHFLRYYYLFIIFDL